MSCEHDCGKPAAFPKTIRNRPGLTRIDYRIGSYAELRERMFDLLNQDALLSAWTHRGADDPGIALMEGAAVVGDILTFYQQLYANELYLRTAQWRESVAELVRLLGYRLAPGVGGEATFALAVKGDQPVTVPQGFGLKAQLDGQDKPAEFESTQEVVAYPWLSRFNLYKPFQSLAVLSGTMSEFVLTRIGGSRPDIDLAPGIRLLLCTPAPSAASPLRLANAEIVVVDDVREEFGELIVRITGAINHSAGSASVAAYVLGDSYRHFGHNAPPTYFTPSGGVMVPNVTAYERHEWEGGDYSYFYLMSLDYYVRQDEVPLDREVENIGAESTVIIQARARDLMTSSTVAQPYTLVTKIDAIESKTLTYGSVSGPSTVLTLEHKLLSLIGDTSSYNGYGVDIRNVSIHAVQGEPLQLRALNAYVTAASGAVLNYYGIAAEVTALQDRALLFVYADGTHRFVQVTGPDTDALAQPDDVRHRGVHLDTQVDYAPFLHADPGVTVYGNLVPATQGKSEAEVVLGSGDRRQTFQTFALPKSPLTYLLDEAHMPAQVPELTVYVDGIAWQQVDSFFNSGPEDAVYVVREDEDNKSYVQFGDGKNGRRLASGLGNVTAVYRVGSGAYGPLKDGARPSITGKLKDFDKLYLPAPVAVGADREDESTARVAAPGKMQSLGRMVSLADIEAEALALPHVLKVRAAWTAPEGVPLVRLTVLTASGETTDLDAVRDSMQTYNRCRGPARYAIDVVQGIRQYLYLHIEAGFDAARQEDDVTAAIKRALGLAGEEGNGIDGADGLLGLHQRQFGQNAHKSQVIGAVQNATGVTWVKLKGAQILDLGTPPETDPTALASPTVDVVQPVLACTDDRILALHATHLTLSLSKDETASECEA